MLWIKTFHIVFVTSWFAGLFYLPRILVNLAMVPADSTAERERLLLMGNAATTVHPNAAQGLNLGLRDVQAALAWLEPLHARGADLGDASALDVLAAQRLPDHRAIARTTDMLAALFTAPWPGLPAVLALGMMGLDRVPPLRRRLLGRLALGAQA